MRKCVFIGAAFVSAMLSAAEPQAPVAQPEAPAAQLEKEEAKWFSAGFDVDLFSAYIFRNAIFNDEMVIQPCVWVDLTLFDCLSVGGWAWQNWNLTDRQSESGVPQEMNESDYEVYVGGNLWQTDDEEYSLNLKLAHDWFTYRYDFETTYELALRLEFNNPFVGVYGQYSQAYAPVSGCIFETGLKRDWNVAELVESENDFLSRLTVGFDWSMTFASGRYFSYYYYGNVPGAYDPATGEYDEECVSDGIGGTTIRGSFSYRVCEHFTVGAVLAFTSTLSGDARDAISYAGHGGSYKDLVWGGLQAKLDF